MKITGYNGSTYLFLNGISVNNVVPLSKHAELLPAHTSVSKHLVDSFTKEPWAFGVMAIFLPGITSQIHISGDTPKDAAVKAWNTLWDVNLLSAIFDCVAVCNLQSDTPAQELKKGSTVNVTNYHLTGLCQNEPYELAVEDECWLSKHFENARNMLDLPDYMTAVSAMASYRNNINSRIRLAILWSGIEAMFGVASEIVFRLSLYVARFLETDDSEARRLLFEKVKRLYKARSVAVHGSKSKINLDESVLESANLLKMLIRACAERNCLPKIEDLAP